MGDKPTILIWSEHPALARELVGAARQALGPGGDVALLAPTGVAVDIRSVDVVFATESADESPEAWAALLAAAVSQTEPALVLVGATKLGLQVAPRLAERIGAGYAAWATGFTLEAGTGAVAARCSLYSGAALAYHQFKPGRVVLTAAPGALTAPSDAPSPERIARQSTLTAEVDGIAPTVIGVRPKATSAARLEEAHAVIDIGQGVKAKEDLALIESVAALLDGQLACTRPLSSDRDWFPEWLGLSGKKVAPELSLLIGVSGAIQHIVGVRDSRVIAAVNNDENAAIFAQADVGVVADLYAFLPVLVERIKARGMRPAWQ